jgi:hypothetical protein
VAEVSVLKLEWIAEKNAEHAPRKDYRASYGTFQCVLNAEQFDRWELRIFKDTEDAAEPKLVAEGDFSDPARAKTAARSFLQRWLRKEARWRIVNMMRSELAYSEIAYEDSGAVYGYTPEQWEDVMAEMDRVLDRLEDYTHG